MAECKKYRDMISCFADGELSGFEKEKLQKHLEACASCRSLLSLYSSVSEAAAGSLLEPPDSFSDSVMSKIKSLSENTNTEKYAGTKRFRSIKPVIISFVAMAACLALAFVVAPGLFGLTGGTKNSAASVPMPGASLQAAPDEEKELYSMRSDAAGDDAEPADDYGETADAAETGPQATMGITAVTNTPPETAAGEEQPLAATGGAADELRVYYAVFIIEGQLPEILESQVLTDNGDGTFSIEISADTAEQLIADGLPAQKGAPNAVTALVKFTPDP